jgi:tripartite-type tricarboxylate transporter receptor subunit TctC
MAHPNVSRRACLASLAGMLPLAVPSARAQAWPQRPVTVVVPFAPGGIADLTARAVAQAMAPALGQAIVVDNRPGAGNVVGAGTVAQATPDGHTLLLMSNANAVSAGLFKKLPFDVQKDFAPICALGAFDLAVFVNAGSPHRHLADLLAAARAMPHGLTMGTISVGSTQQLAAELLKAKAGVDLLTVPYKGTPAVLQALRAGEIDVAVEILGPWLGQVQAGTVRALAVSSDQRFAGLSEVPTVGEAGVPGYAIASWNALAAPARTPRPVVERLNALANQALAQPAVRQQLLGLGVRPLGGPPQRLQQLLSDEIRRWGEAIRAAKITPQ